MAPVPGRARRPRQARGCSSWSTSGGSPGAGETPTWPGRHGRVAARGGRRLPVGGAPRRCRRLPADEPVVDAGGRWPRSPRTPRTPGPRGSLLRWTEPEDNAHARVAVLRSEMVWWRRHRRLIADVATLARGVDVEHLGRRAVVRRRPAAGARVRGDGSRSGTAPERTAVRPARGSRGAKLGRSAGRSAGRRRNGEVDPASVLADEPALLVQDPRAAPAVQWARNSTVPSASSRPPRVAPRISSAVHRWLRSVCSRAGRVELCQLRAR